MSAALLALLILLPATVLASGASDFSGDLDLNPDHAPYQVSTIAGRRCLQGGPDRTSYMMAELEGDGSKELVTGELNRLLGLDCEDGYIKPRFQINLKPGWNFHHHSEARLGVATDVNGDLISEVHLTLVRDDRRAWRFQTIDLATQEVITDEPLPLGADNRADGIWDGSYMPVGVFDDADGQGTTGIVLLRNADYDASLRGLLVVDARTGHKIWEWACGPNPSTYHTDIADLDGDGQQEIVLYGNSPDNLGGRLINGTSDDHSYLFVISATGQELWRQELGGTFRAGGAMVSDLNGDGLPEIITYTGIGATGETNQLAVWDYAGRRRLAAQRQEAMFSGVAVLPGPQPGSSWLVTGSNQGFVTRYLFADGRLARDGRRVTSSPMCKVVGALDILPEPGTEVIAAINGTTTLAILNSRLEPLAVMEDDGGYAKDTPVLWQVTKDRLALVVGESRAYFVLEFTRRPRNLAAVARLGLGGALLLLLLFGAYLVGRRAGRGHRTTLAPVPALPKIADREVLYRMWRQLDDVKHERFLEANRGLRRLVWLLEAYAADLGASETLGVRIGQLLDDFTNSVQPRLLEILQMANAEKFESAAVAKTAVALERLGEHLSHLDVETLSPESIQAHSLAMNEALGEIESGFLHLWRSLHRYFSTDPVRMIQGMFLVREVEFERAGVDTQLVGADEVADPVCLVDSSSLRFILDNLVENALRAMSDSSRKLLAISVSRTATELTLRVTDSGSGIEPSRQEAIFNGRTSDRPGGGSGLFRTREILQRWRGEIHLDRSLSDQGTTFVVKLRAANKLETAARSNRALSGEA